jgi:AbrB family looped-hinge helix DNA binding protein
MATATVTSKGQITIPAKVREELGLKPGTLVTFVPAGKNEYLIMPKNSSVRALKGILRKPDHYVSIEDMNEGIVEGVLAEWRR